MFCYPPLNTVKHKSFDVQLYNHSFTVSGQATEVKADNEVGELIPGSGNHLGNLAT